MRSSPYEEVWEVFGETYPRALTSSDPLGVEMTAGWGIKRGNTEETIGPNTDLSSTIVKNGVNDAPTPPRDKEITSLQPQSLEYSCFGVFVKHYLWFQKVTLLASLLAREVAQNRHCHNSPEMLVPWILVPKSEKGLFSWKIYKSSLMWIFKSSQLLVRLEEPWYRSEAFRKAQLSSKFQPDQPNKLTEFFVWLRGIWKGLAFDTVLNRILRQTSPP